MKLMLLLAVMLFTLLGANSQTLSDSRFRTYESPNLNRNVTAKVIKNDWPSVNETKVSEPKRAEGENCQVDLYLDFDPESYGVDKMLFFDGERSFDQWEIDLYDPVNGSNMVTLPSGTYDILVTFVKYGMPPIELNVVREQMVVNQGMQLSFNPDEAENHIHFQTLAIDGEPVATNRFALDEDDQPVLLEQGNVDEVFFEGFVLIDGKIFFAYNGNFGTPIEGVDAGGELFADVFINDVSERFTFYNYRVATGFDYDVYTSSYEVKGASGDVTITNDPADYIEYELPLTSQKHQEDEIYLSFQEHVVTHDNFGTGQGVVFVPAMSGGETLKLYLAASPDDSQAGFYPIVEPLLSIKTIEQIETPWGEIYESERFDPVMEGMPLTVSDGKIVLANNGVNSHVQITYPRFDIEHNAELSGNIDYQYYPIWPTHPVFTYSVERQKENLGDNCPLVVTNPMQYTAMPSPFGEIWVNKNFTFNYLGRYGETNLDDVADTQVQIQVNGEDFYSASGEITAPLDDMSGVVDATFVNDCVMVDGLPGSNTTMLHFNTEGDSPNPPTMTMLHFKDSNDDVTDRFATADDGSFEFSAGDFNLVTTPMGYFAFDRFAPEEVEISYSPYGEDSWSELSAEEIPEYFWPVMGAFYRGSLAGVTGQGLNGWFDLKIRLTDAAGNWQEQVLSPAFRIDDLAYTSVATVTPEKSGDNAIYNLAGQRMRGDLGSLPRGIYIAGGKKVVIK